MRNSLLQRLLLFLNAIILMTYCSTNNPPPPDDNIYDIDNDSVIDESDNCVDMANTEQLDSDNDGIGDVCDLVDDSIDDSTDTDIDNDTGGNTTSSHYIQQFRYNTKRTGQTPYNGISSNTNLHETYVDLKSITGKFENAINNQATVASDGTIYFGTWGPAGCILYTTDSKSDECKADPIGQGKLIALNEDLSKKWVCELPSPFPFIGTVESTPTILTKKYNDQNIIVTGRGDKKLYAILDKGTSCEIIVTYNTDIYNDDTGEGTKDNGGQLIYAPILDSSDNIYFATTPYSSLIEDYGSAAIYSVKLEIEPSVKFVENWRFPPQTKEADYSWYAREKWIPAISLNENNNLLYAADQNNNVYAINVTNGNLTYQYNTNSSEEDLLNKRTVDFASLVISNSQEIFASGGKATLNSSIVYKFSSDLKKLYIYESDSSEDLYPILASTISNDGATLFAGSGYYFVNRDYVNNSPKGKLLIFNTEDLSLKQEIIENNPIGGIIVSKDNYVYYKTRGDLIYLDNLSTCTLKNLDNNFITKFLDNYSCTFNNSVEPIFAKIQGLSYDTSSQSYVKIFGDAGLKLNGETGGGTISLYEKDVLLYARTPDIQRMLDVYGWTGRAKSGTGDYLWVIDANLAALKTDGVMEKQIAYALDARDPEHPIATVTLTYHNTNRSINWRYTRYRDYVRVYVPEGSELISSEGAMLNDKTKTGGRVIPGTVDVMKDLGKTVFGAFWAVEPGETRALSFMYRLPSSVLLNQKEPGLYTLLVQRQPGSEQRLTLDLNFGKNIMSASPAEEAVDFGDMRYKMSYPLRADQTVHVKVASP